MLRAGGALVQLYTGFVYEGPPAVNRIKRALARALERDNVKSVKDLIGADVR
jgi:dihydroorotate dehydrogenase